MNELIERFPNIEENVNLSQFTTFKIGGNARFFLTSDDIDEVRNVVKFCNENNIRLKTIGWGSNMLISDDGFNGLILKLNNKSLSLSNDIFTLGAGVMLRKFIEFALENGYIGLEFLAGIPGTIGGAIYGNAGSYGKSISDVVESVEIIDDLGNIKTLTKSDCQFSYRDSIFKKQNYIIFSVKFKLETGDCESSREIVRNRVAERASKHPLEYGSAGSFFKNIELTDSLRERLNDIDLVPFEKSGKIPAAFLIENLGLKGYCIGDACVSEKHANFLINKGKAKASEIIKLSNTIKEKVKERFEVELEEEVQYVE